MEYLYPPLVEDGQVLGAATLNAFSQGVQWLLGRAHETYQAQRSYGYMAGSTWGELCRGWIYLTSTRGVFFCVQVTTSPAGAPWNLALHMMREEGGTPTFVEVWSTTGTGNTTIIQAITVPSQFQAEALTRFRWVGRITSGTASMYLTVQHMTSYYTFSTSPPTFSNGSVSSAAGINALRGCLVDMIRYLPPFNGLSWTSDSSYTVDRFYGGAEWYDVSGTFYWRYRPDQVMVGLLVTQAEAGWRWRAILRRADGSESVIYTSSAMPSAMGVWFGIEEPISLSSLGIPYRESVAVRLQVSPAAPPNPGDHRYLTYRRPYAFRLSSQVPSASWQSVPYWQHGDTNIGAARLNALSNNLQLLRGTGHDGIFYEGYGAYEDTLGLWGTPVYYGIRNKPILMYLPKAGESPRLRFGTTLTRDMIFSLPSEDTPSWLAFDLRQCTALPPGQVYLVEGVRSAGEAERVLNIAPWTD